MTEEKSTITEVSEEPPAHGKSQFGGRLLRLIVVSPLFLVMLILEKIFALTTTIFIPPVTGPFKVGRRCFHWVDSSRREIFSDDPDAKRQLLVWFWYPASEADNSTKAAYLPLPWTKRLLKIKESRPTNAVVCNALDNAPVLALQSPCPLLVFAPVLAAVK